MSEKSGGTVGLGVPSVNAYLLTIALVVLMALVTVVVIVERGGADEETLIVHVIAFTAPTVAAILSLMKSAESVAVVKDLHVQVNSRMTQLLELTASAAHAEGVLSAQAGEAAVPAVDKGGV